MNDDREILMGLATSAQSADTDVEPATLPRKAWHRPNITVIDIKRTMFLFGSIADGFSASL